MSLSGVQRWAAAIAVMMSVLAVGSSPDLPSREAGRIRLTDTGVAIPGRYIVVLPAGGPVRPRAEALAARYGGTVRSVYETVSTGFSAYLSEEQARRLASDPRVSTVEQDQVYTVAETQNFAPWHLDRVDQRARPLDLAYSHDDDDSGATVYVVDTGIRTTHSEFQGRRATNGWDFIDDDAVAEDCRDHGTGVASVVGGQTVGVAKHVRLVALRAYGCDGRADGSSLLDSIEWITMRPGRPAVANLSATGICRTGSGQPTECPRGAESEVVAALTRSVGAGVHWVLAAGNDSTDACGNPFTKAQGVIIVGGSNQDDGPSTGSNPGTCVDLFAPGQQVFAATRRSDTDIIPFTGNSFAAPVVAGALALMLSRPGWAMKTPAEVKAELLANWVTTGVLTGIGTGSPNRLLYVPPPPAGSAPSVAVARNGNGKLTLYGVNSAGTLFYRTQNDINTTTSWTGWTNSINPGFHSVCADTDGLPHMALIGVRRSQQIWHRRQAFTDADLWSNWLGFDGLLSMCAAALDNTGRLEILGVNAKGQLFTRSEVDSGGGRYTDWTELVTDSSVRAVAAERNANGAVEVFAVDVLGEIQNCWETGILCGPPGSWHHPGSDLPATIVYLAVARQNTGELELVSVDAAGVVRRTRGFGGTAPWSEWSVIPTPPEVGQLRSLAVERNEDGRVELFAVNLAGQLWHSWQIVPDAFTYSAWFQLDGLLRP